MNTNVKLKSGDFWSTRSLSDIPGMLVFVEKPNNNTLFGYPMFCEASQATGECFHLDGHPDFDGLLDERWVNFGNPIKINAKSLYGKLGHSQFALDCLQAFKKGNDIPLDNGVPMLNGIGDRREAFHTGLLQTLQKLAGASFVELTINALRKTLLCDIAIPVLDYLKENNPCIPILAAAPMAVRSESLISRNQTKALIPDDSLGDSLAKGIILQVNGKDVMLQMVVHGDIAHFIISGRDICEVEICMGEGGKWQKVPEVNTGIYVTRPSKLLSGKVQFVFKDGDTEIFDLNIRNE